MSLIVQKNYILVIQKNNNNPTTYSNEVDVTEEVYQLHFALDTIYNKYILPNFEMNNSYPTFTQEESKENMLFNKIKYIIRLISNENNIIKYYKIVNTKDNGKTAAYFIGIDFIKNKIISIKPIGYKKAKNIGLFNNSANSFIISKEEWNQVKKKIMKILD